MIENGTVKDRLEDFREDSSIKARKTYRKVRTGLGFFSFCVKRGTKRIGRWTRLNKAPKAFKDAWRDYERSEQ